MAEGGQRAGNILAWSEVAVGQVCRIQIPGDATLVIFVRASHSHILLLISRMLNLRCIRDRASTQQDACARNKY
eukprot:6181379-Pleurochrysis_carterae.AAC.1